VNAPAGRPAIRWLAPLVTAAALAGAGCMVPERTTVTSNQNEQGDPQRRAQVRLELASLYFSRGQHAVALDEVRVALAARPDMAEGFSLRGLIQAAMGESKLAEESFQRALQLAPRDADTMHNYGWMLCQTQRYADAETQFQRALAQPQYGSAGRTLSAQGLCQARQGRLSEAERSLSRAYELDPANPFIAFNLAEVLLRRGELERARFYVRRVNSRADQSNAQTLWLAARIEHKLGNVDGAREWGTRLRERFPQSGEALQFERGRFDD